MTVLHTLVEKPLATVQPSLWKRDYELRLDDTCVGKLSFPKLFSNEAVAECDEGHWIFNRKGIWRPVLSIHRPQEKKPMTLVPVKHFGRTLTVKLPRYRTLRMSRNIWATEYVLATNMNVKLVELSMNKLPLSPGQVIIGKKAEDVDELPWLLFLLWYTALLNQRRAHAH